MASLPAADTAQDTATLTAPRLAMLIGYGLMLWASGVLLLRWVAGAGLLDGDGWQMLVYALVVVGTVPCIPLGPWLAGLPRSETVRATAIVCATACAIDGLVIGFAPWIYADDPVMARACAGCLLWAIGVALALGLVRRG